MLASKGLTLKKRSTLHFQRKVDVAKWDSCLYHKEDISLKVSVVSQLASVLSPHDGVGGPVWKKKGYIRNLPKKMTFSLLVTIYQMQQQWVEESLLQLS